MPLERRKVLLAIVAAVAVVGFSIAGFRSGRIEAVRDSQNEAPIQAPERVLVKNGERVIVLAPAVQRADGIETVTLHNTAQPESLRAYGTVLNLGSLTELVNSYTNAKAQVDIARAKLSASQAAFARAKTLYQDQQNVSAADLQATEAAFHTDEAGLAAARSLLETLSVSAQQDWGSLLGNALVRGAPLLSRLTTRQDVLLQITLRPGETADPKAGSVYAEREDGSLVALTFISAANRTDPRIQGASFLFTAPASTGLLPGMSIAARVPITRAVRGVVIPPTAVIWTQGQAWAYFPTGTSTFVRRLISTEQPTPTGGYVVTGEPDPVQVVTRGAQMLLSEEFRAFAQVSE